MIKASIIVPCYNQAEYLGECLQSVLDQTFQDWECIVVNDGSSDNTDEIAKNWLEKDNRFKYFYQENAGLSAARNKGIENANGEFILPLDADDKISKNYCKLAIEEFENDSELKVVYCEAERFGFVSGKWNLPVFSLLNLTTTNQFFCSAFFRKTEWSKVNGYDVNLIYGWEDWDFWIAILKENGKVKQIKELCFFYRTKQRSMVKNMTQENYDFSNNYIARKHIEFFLKNYNQLNLEVKKMKSKKHVFNLFTKTFFGFSIFN